MSIFRRAVSGLRKLILGRVRGDGGSQGVSLPSVGMRMEENNLTPTTRVVDGTIRYADTIPRNTIQTGDKYGLTLNGTNEYGTGPVWSSPNIAISLWFKQPPAASTATLIGSWVSASNKKQFILNSDASGPLRFLAQSNVSGTAVIAKTYTTVVDDDEWHHVYAEVTGSTMRLWLDGVEEAVSSTTGTAGTYSGSLFATDQPIRIGAAESVIANYAGSVDDIRVYGTTLLPAEIQALAASAPGDPPVETESLPLLHYKFEDAVTSTTITNDGVLENADLALTGNSVMNMRDQVGYLGFSDNTGFGDIRPLKPKYGLTLNGSTEYGTGPVLSSAGLTNEMTVTFWLSPSSITAPADYSHIIGSWHHLINTNRSWIIDINGVGGGIIGFYVSADGTNANFSSSVSSIAVALNTWVHVAATFKDGTLKLYLDGEEVGVTGSTGTGAGASLYQGSNQIVLGASASKTGQYTHGSLDDIRVYDTALPESEIKALAAVKPGGTPPTTSATPLIHYTFEDPVSSPIVKNVGSLANADLTLTGVLANMRAQTGYVSFANSVGYGASFTTNGTNGQYLDTGLTLSNDVAFTVWRRARYLSTNGYDLDGFRNDGGEVVRLGRDNGSNQIYVNLGDQVADTPGVTIPNNELHTMCIQSSTTGNEKLWLNGVKLKDAASSMSAFTGQNISYKIGLQHSTSGGLEHGSHTEYYEYLIAKRVLTEDELTWLDSGGTYGTPIDFLNDPDILVYYDFEDEHPDFVYNRANPSLPGIIVGGEWSTVPRSSVDTDKDVQQAGSSYRTAVSFPGSTNKVDFGSVLIGATDDFDISFDFNAYTLTSDFLFSQWTDAIPGRMYIILFDNGSVEFYVQGSLANVQLTSSAGSVTAGRWYTVRATRVGDVFTLYLDDMQIGTQTRAGISVEQVVTRLGTSRTVSDDFHGLISNVNINGTSYLTKPDETIAGATLTNASYVNVVRGRPGTLTHTGTVPRDPVLTNRAVALNGTSEYVTVPVTLAGATSWEFACKFKTSDTSAHIFENRDGDNDGVSIAISSGTIRVQSDATDVSTVATFSDDAWHSLRAVWDGANITIYVDGIAYASGAMPAASAIARTDSLIGANYVGANFAGSVADIQITIDGSVVGKWPCSEPSGTICYDVSGNNNHGTGAPATRTGTQNLIDTHMTDGYSVATWFDGSSYLDKGSRQTSGSLNALTVEGWAYFPAGGSAAGIMSEYSTANTNWRVYKGSGDNLVFTLTGNIREQTDAAVPIGRPFHFCCVYSESAATIVVDNVVVASSTAGGTIPASIPDAAAPFQIGTWNSGSGLDESVLSRLSVTSRAWTDEERAARYSAGTLPSDATAFEDGGLTSGLTVVGAPEQRVLPVMQPQASAYALGTYYDGVDDSYSRATLVGGATRLCASFYMVADSIVDSYLVSEYDATGDQRSWVVTLRSDGRLRLTSSDDGATPTAKYAETTDPVVTAGTLYYVNVTFDNGTVSWEIDGVAVSSTVGSSGGPETPTYASTADFVIGSYVGGSSYFPGTISQLIVHKDPTVVWNSDTKTKLRTGANVAETLADLGGTAWYFPDGDGRETLQGIPMLTRSSSPKQRVVAGLPAANGREATWFDGANDWYGGPKVLEGSDVWSIGCFVQVDSLAVGNGIASQYITTGNQREFQLFVFTDGSLRCNMSGDGTTVAQVIGTPAAITVGKQHYVTVAVDGVAGTAKLFVDGVDVTQAVGSIPATLFIGSATFAIGSATSTGIAFLAGTISQLLIHDGAYWSAANVNAIRAAKTTEEISAIVDGLGGTAWYFPAANDAETLQGIAPLTKNGNPLRRILESDIPVGTWYDGTNDSYSRPTLIGGATRLCASGRLVTDAIGLTQTVVSEYKSSSNDRSFLIVVTPTGNLRATISADGIAPVNYETDSAVVTAGTLHDFAFTFDGSTATWEVDGAVKPGTWNGSVPASVYSGVGNFMIANYEGGAIRFNGTLSQLLIHKDPITVWNATQKAAIRNATTTQEISDILGVLGGTAWYFPHGDGFTETLQNLDPMTQNGEPEQDYLYDGKVAATYAAGTTPPGLPAISYGPGVLAPGQSLDLYCGEDDAPYSIGLSDHLVDGDYDFGDGSEGDILFVSGDDNHEKLVLLDDATDYPELFE